MFHIACLNKRFKSTNIMSKQTEMQTSAQAEIEDFNRGFQERLRGLVCSSLLAMFEQEVTSRCGETYRPTASVHRRPGSEMVTIQTTSGKELTSKRRVREELPSGLEWKVRLKSYDEVKRHKEMFDEVLEKGCFFAVAKLLGEEEPGKLCRISGDDQAGAGLAGTKRWQVAAVGPWGDRAQFTK